MASLMFFVASASVFPWLMASGSSTQRAANHPVSGSFTRLTVKVFDFETILSKSGSSIDNHFEGAFERRASEGVTG